MFVVGNPVLPRSRHLVSPRDSLPIASSTAQMTRVGSRSTVTALAAALTALISGCAPAGAPAPVPAPAPLPRPAEPVRTERAVLLPSRMAGNSWRVQSVARIALSGAGAPSGEQRVESSGLVSWSLERQPSGALRGTGQVDSFTVRTSFDATKGAMLPIMPAQLLLDAAMDSSLVRITTRPPLVNECDRPEAGAAALARELLVRVPNGARQGDRWKDSTVTLVCRSGVPLVVYTTVVSVLDRIDDQQLVVKRDVRAILDGKGGSAFRGLELSGTSSGSQRVEISAVRGTVERLEGTSTLALQATERLPGSPPKVQQITQKVEVKAERVR